MFFFLVLLLPCSSGGAAAPRYAKLDCSIRTQNLAFVQQFQQNVICPTNAAVAGGAPKLIFGIEIGFPNFPINLDPSLPGGGTSKADTAIPQYRYNDPWAVLDVPLKARFEIKKMGAF